MTFLLGAVTFVIINYSIEQIQTNSKWMWHFADTVSISLPLFVIHSDAVFSESSTKSEEEKRSYFTRSKHLDSGCFFSPNGYCWVKFTHLTFYITRSWAFATVQHQAWPLLSLILPTVSISAIFEWNTQSHCGRSPRCRSRHRGSLHQDNLMSRLTVWISHFGERIVSTETLSG